jgi:hypothetical protein
MMRKVRQVTFVSGQAAQLFGRRVASLRAQDGYEMRFWPESGVLLIRDAKETREEVVVHASRVDIYLEPETVEEPKKAKP